MFGCVSADPWPALPGGSGTHVARTDVTKCQTCVSAGNGRCCYGSRDLTRSTDGAPGLPKPRTHTRPLVNWVHPPAWIAGAASRPRQCGTVVSMTDEELLAAILPILDIDLQAVAVFEAWDVEAIAQYRRVGRRAVRRLGHRAVTLQSDPAKRDDGRVVVIVLAEVPSEHPDSQRLHDRGEALIQRMSFRPESPAP